MHCNQDGCNKPAAYRFTWPGNDEAGICEAHAQKMRQVADAMGLHVQLIPIANVSKDAPRSNRRWQS